MRTTATRDNPPVLVDNIAVTLVSIIVPTLREAANIRPLLDQVAVAMSGRAYEVIVVDDDSRDGTAELCVELSARHPVRCITRSDPVDGLGGAVLQGLREARGDVFVVMDADLQHPPAKLPALIDAVESGAEFAVGSRTIAGGSMSHAWPVHRRFTSWVAKTLARPFAGTLTDVMSGYFALPRAVFERGQHLAPLGFKIGLELICKCRVRRLVEIPIHFGVRTQGDSKLTVREQFRYLEHLSRLYDFTFPRLGPVLKFLVVVAIGFALGALASVAMQRTSPQPVAAIAGYGVTIFVTALFHARYVATQRHWLIRPHAWRDFCISAAIEWAVYIAVAFYLWKRLSSPMPLELFALPFAAATVVRYVLRKELLLDVRGLRFMPDLRNRVD
jgi:dolichol-phosphate mannosyltransferase